MDTDRTKLEKLFHEHFIDEPSSEVFDAMNEIIDYAEKAVKLFAIPAVVGRSEQFKCDCCNGTGMVEGDYRDELESCLTCNGRGTF